MVLNTSEIPPALLCIAYLFLQIYGFQRKFHKIPLAFFQHICYISIGNCAIVCVWLYQCPVLPSLLTQSAKLLPLFSGRPAGKSCRFAVFYTIVSILCTTCQNMIAVRQQFFYAFFHKIYHAFHFKKIGKREYMDLTRMGFFRSLFDRRPGICPKRRDRQGSAP